LVQVNRTEQHSRRCLGPAENVLVLWFILKFCQYLEDVIWNGKIIDELERFGRRR
jgi:hypothetical protein